MESSTAVPDGLRDIHKECLRLAAQHYSSKEIARMLGISRHTVDQRLRHATQQLGASSRFDAARRFQELEAMSGSGQCEPLLYHSPYLSDSTPGATFCVSDSERDPLADKAAFKLQDAQAPYGFSTASELDGLFSNSVSTGETRQKPLSLPLKSLLAVTVAAASLLAFGAAVAALEVLSRI